MRRLLACALLAGGCSSPPASMTAPTIISMDFARGSSLYDAPFPSDDLLRADGTADLSKFPNPNQVPIIDQAIALIAEGKGFAQSGAIYFRASAPLDPTSLPDVNGSVTAASSLFVVRVDRPQTRLPVDAAALADGGPFGAKNLLALLPIQGLPLDAGATYAAVITTRVRDASGHAIGAATLPPAKLSGDAAAHYQSALQAISQSTAPDQIAAIAVFTTGSPTTQMGAVRDAILAAPAPTVATPKRGEIFPDYCVYNTTIQMPVYQAGKPPYDKTGGAWAFDGSGKPIVDHMESAGVIFTIPRKPVPAAGWPLLFFVRAGGGGDRPLVDRGVCATPEFTMPITPGTGPAQDLARVGFAGVEVDGPLEGTRNTTGGNEDSLIFNVLNPSALRDNVRQSAVEMALVAKVMPAMSWSAADCPGADMAHFDDSHLALMGHSMGAWIAPLAAAYEPKFGALVLSGAGGSYIANVMDKIKPTRIRPLAEIILNYDMDGFSLERHDPALTLIQWAAEPSDPQVYGARIVHAPPTGAKPRHVLMLQGIVDHYILPSIANATSLAMGLDEAGPAYDAGNAEETMLGQTPIGTLLPLAGRSMIALPASANIDANTTAVLIQHPADKIEDGHETNFQTGPPKHQYRCFLASWLKGVPSVPPDGDEEAPCP
jgi:hypothetical protein